MKFKLFTITLLVSLFSSFVFCDKTQPSDWTQTFQIADNLVSENSSHQKITIFNNKTLGKILMLDDIVQFSEKDEFFYHEMLAHVPLTTHPNPKKVLIIGGGDGAILREVAKYPDIEEIIAVEVDAKIVDLCKQHYPSLADGAFDDPRVRLLIDDGYSYLKKTQFKYDLIIVDSTDPLGPGRSLFQKHFYFLCKEVLTPNGILVTQAGCPITQIETLKTTLDLVSEIFKESKPYMGPAPSQLGGIKAFTLSFKNKDTSNSNRFSPIEKRCEMIEGKVKYYTPEIHNSAFSLPKGYLEEPAE